MQLLDQALKKARLEESHKLRLEARARHGECKDNLYLRLTDSRQISQKRLIPRSLILFLVQKECHIASHRQQLAEFYIVKGLLYMNHSCHA